MSWIKGIERLRAERRPGELVTVASARGHVPRESGAKMVVAADRTWGSVGGGNLEAVCVDRARQRLQEPGRDAELTTFSLSDKAPYQRAVQCCGGEVTVLLEPLPVLPAVAVFGLGHVGLELARVLARHDLDLHLVDSREDELAPSRLAPLDDAVAHVHVHHTPVLPELVLAGLAPGTHVLVMTHDHAEDVALCDAALRHPDLGSIGLIGSSAKWSRFRRTLLAQGHDEAGLARITTPIGLPGLGGKEPATIAVSVAAQLLLTLQAERSATTPRDGGAATVDGPRAADRVEEAR